MKTLYINISGENIQSTDEVIVVGKPTDDLAGKFYFELGNQILKGAVALSVKNKRELITEFIQQHKDVYEEKIHPQLEHAKHMMLSNDLRGEVKVQLPQEYIQWLNFYGTSDYSAIAKSLTEKDGIVTINLERIYRNGIQLLINSIEPGDYGQLVVNDDAVEDDTEMVVAIREKLKNPMLPLVLLAEYNNKFQKVGEYQTECRGASYNTVEEDIFPFHGVSLGTTSISSLANKHFVYLNTNGTSFCDVDDSITFYQQADEIVISYMTLTNCGQMPLKWKELYDLSWGMSFEQCKLNLAQKNVSIIKINIGKFEAPGYITGTSLKVTCVTCDNKYILELYFEDNLIKTIYCSLNTCVKCKSKSIQCNYFDTLINKYICEDCGHIIGRNHNTKDNLSISDSYIHRVFSYTDASYNTTSLGKTSISEIAQRGIEVKSNSEYRYCFIDKPYGGHIMFGQLHQAKTITFMYLTHDTNIPPNIAEEFGLSWKLSYNQVLQKLIQANFLVTITELPMLRFKNNSHFSAKISATYGNRVLIKLSFSACAENGISMKDKSGTFCAMDISLL